MLACVSLGIVYGAFAANVISGAMQRRARAASSKRRAPTA